MVEFSRGSKWRRWDLHVHTPETKKNDKYKGFSIEEKWDNFYDKISSYIGDGSDPMKNIAVIGITHYLSIDKYLKVKTDNRMPKSVKIVLPNIEMRILPPSKKEPINLHCIFNPDIVSELESRFFSSLKFRFANRTYFGSKSQLIQLGKVVNSNLSDIDAYKVGIDKFIVNPNDMCEILENNKDIRENVILIFSNSSNDGASGLTKDDSQMALVRQHLYQISDMLFFSNFKDIEYFLGKRSDSSKEIIEKYNALKPFVHGCDAHELDRLFEPVQRRYCWIKADPTFNGLKQVIYEPEARVRISAIMPETKASYNVMESVEIDDKEADFQKEKIIFNDKLNCIIGGKSTKYYLRNKSI